MIMKSDLKGDVVEPFPFARLEHSTIFITSNSDTSFLIWTVCHVKYFSLRKMFLTNAKVPGMQYFM